MSELRSKLDDVHKESLTDPLTGIANRKAFDNALAAAEEQVAQSGDPVSLLLCDIDNFKKFNDTWGHQTGDQVLRLVANCLSENVKGRDTAARYGGEEFGVVLRGTALKDAMRIAEQIRHRGRRPPAGEEIHRRRAGHHHHLHRRGPVCAATRQRRSTVRRADACLYGAKQNGRNLVISGKRPAHGGSRCLSPQTVFHQASLREDIFPRPRFRHAGEESLYAVMGL